MVAPLMVQPEQVMVTVPAPTLTTLKINPAFKPSVVGAGRVAAMDEPLEKDTNLVVSAATKV